MNSVQTGPGTHTDVYCLVNHTCLNSGRMVGRGSCQHRVPLAAGFKVCWLHEHGSCVRGMAMRGLIATSACSHIILSLYIPE